MIIIYPCMILCSFHSVNIRIDDIIVNKQNADWMLDTDRYNADPHLPFIHTFSPHANNNISYEKTIKR